MKLIACSDLSFGRNLHAMAAILLACFCLPFAAHSQNLIANGSFETLTASVSSDTYTVTSGSLATNVATGWVLGTSGVNNGYDGILTTSGPFGNKVIEDGSYGVFLQGAGWVAQTISLSPGVYTLTFYAMGRDASTGGNGVNPVAVSLGDLVSDTITPTNSAQNSASDWILYTYNFTVTTAGDYTLQFTGTLPEGVSGDHTTYIDNVILVPSSITAPSVSNPNSESLYAGTTARFTVSASGTLPLVYQWQHDSTNLTDGGNISGSASNELVITNISAADAGSYAVVVNNSGGIANSGIAQLTLVTPVSAYEMAVMSNNPVAYYRFNETADPSSGTTAALDYAGGFNGLYGFVVENAFDGIAGPLPSDGFSGFESTNGAALFTSGYAASEITAGPWELNTNAVTLLAWINPSGPQTSFTGVIYCRGGGDGSGMDYTASTDANGNHTLGYTWNNDGQTWGWNSGLVPPQNQWSMVALVVSPSSATIYILNTNGVQSATHTYTHKLAPFFATSAIGQDPLGTGRTFNGEIDEVAIFNQSLTSSQLAVIYGQAAGISAFVPNVTSEPTSDLMLYAGENARITVGANGIPAPLYQWQVGTNGSYVNLANGGRIAGATSATLTLSNLDFSDPTNFIVDVSNIAGSTNSTATTLTVLPLPGPGTYASNVLADQPIAYYRFNEDSDTLDLTNLLAFDFVGGFNGVYGSTVQNQFYGIAGPSPSDGFPGFEADNGAAQFVNGYSTSEVQVQPWNLNTNNVTMTAWIYPDSSQGGFTGLIVCSGSSDGSDFNFTGGQDTNGIETLGYTWAQDGNTWSWNSGIAPPIAQWSFVALTITPTNATVYIINTNGTKTAVHTYAHPVQPFSGNTFIGTDPFNAAGRGFNGIMDEVAIFNHAFTASQVTALYDSAAGIVGNVVLSPAWNGSTLTLTWPGGGQLMQASSLAGPWTAVPSATSPYVVTPGAPQMFYRVLVQ